jgi:3-hydroxybutyrate dehydrogenase
MNAPRYTVLITGAGSGLGRGLALCLSRRGHTVLATDLRPDAARETAALVADDGGQAEAFALDVTKEQGVREFMAGLGWRGVDVLVNNAGLQHVAKVEDFPAARWDEVVDVMLRGAFLMTRAVLPGMRARGFGRLIHIGSIHSLVASAFKSAYVAAKHGLLGLSKVAALETADADITINTICPAYIRTPLVEAQVAAQAREHGIGEQQVIDRIMLGPMPKKVFITEEEVAAAVEYLAGPLARNVTGQTITIDGGWTSR